MRRWLWLPALLCLVAPLSAQFTIPNNDASGITSNPQSIWMQADIDMLVRGVYGSGVNTGCAVTSQSNMTVAVSAGSATINHALVQIAAGTPNITAAHATLSRVDLVSVNSAGTTVVTAGTPAANPSPPALPANAVLCAAVYVPPGATTITAARIVDKRVLLGSGTPPDVNVLTFGAKCDASTDDTVAIRAAIHVALSLPRAAGTLVIPDGDCRHSGVLTLGDDSGGTATTYLNIRGAGMNVSCLCYTGAGGTALRLVRNKYFRIQDVYIYKTSGGGTSIGVEETGYGGIGTETLAGVFDHVGVGGFAVGIQAGSAGVTSGVAAASDILYNYLELANNGTGFKTGTDLNILNHVFTDLNITSNTVAGLNQTVGTVYVRGGSSHGNAIDFLLGTQAEDFHLQDFRAENGGGTYLVKSQGTRVISLDHVFQSGAVDNTETFVSSNGDSSIAIRDSYAPGRINSLTTSPVHVEILNSYVNGDTTVPMFFVATAGISSVDFRGNHNLNGGNPFNDVFPDVVGTMVGSYGLWKSTTLTHGNTPRVDGAYFPDTIQLHTLRSLAAGSQANGRNWRVRWNFAASTTAAVTFTRTIVCGVSAGQCALSSGTAYFSDVGLKAAITISGTTYQGVIASVSESGNSLTWLDATGATNSPCGSCGAGAVSIVIGENEPDALYLAAATCEGISPPAVSSKATTGFTLTAAGSTSAPCLIWVLR